MNTGALHSRSVNSRFSILKPYLLLFLGIPFIQAFTSGSDLVKPESMLMVCDDPEPITRWNQLPPPDRALLDDADPTTNVTGFETGFCNGMGNPITVDITADSAVSLINPLINNRPPTRWGLTSFDNSRSTTGESGNQYCFTFSEALPFEISSEEHQFFHQYEHITVTAFNGINPVNLSAALNGTSAEATLSGDGTPVVSFAANNHQGRGIWWSVNSQGNDITQVCVEYYRTGAGANLLGGEPFSLSLCNSDRCLFEDPFAVADPDNPSPNINVADNILFTKETVCTAQSASGEPGNIDATIRLKVVNNGSNTITDLQIIDDLTSQIPGNVLVDFLGVTFPAPGNTVMADPTPNLTYEGDGNVTLFSGTDGTMSPGDTLVVDLHLELNPNEMAQYDAIGNQATFTAIGQSFNLVSAASDAPTGAPGDNGGDVEALLLHIPAANLTVSPIGYDPKPGCDANGEVEAEVEIRFANTGNVVLDQISVEADLEAQLGGAFIGMASLPVISSSTATSDPLFNVAFDGSSTDSEIFDLSSGMLEQGQEIHIRVTLRLDPNAMTGIFPLSVNVLGAARGLLENTDPLSGCHANGHLMAFDTSDAGLVPESNNLNFLGDTGGHSDPFPLQLPNLNTVKEVASFLPAASQVPGNQDVVIRLIMENTGNVALDNLNLTDDISTLLGNSFVAVSHQPHIVSSTADSDPGLGTFPTAIFDGTSGLLQPGQTIAVEVVVEVDPDAANSFPIFNQAEASATGPALDSNTVIVNDLSDSGDDPNSTNPGEPGDTGCSNDSTVFNLPALMVAQEIIGVDYATSGTSGNFDAIVQVVVQNVGSVDLEDFSLMQNLTIPQLLGTAFVSVTGAPQIVPVGAHGTIGTASSDPQVNPGYNGIGDLLDDTAIGLLAPGELFILHYRIEVDPEAAGAPNLPKLQVVGYGTGDGPSGNPLTVSDSSDAGHTPQSTNPGRPGDSGGTNDPTPLGNCGTEIGALSCNNSIQVSMNEDCLAGLTASMVLEGELWQCASDDLLPFGTYYEIFMVTNQYGVVIPDAIPATPNVFEIDGSYIGQTLTVKVQDVVNSNSCWGTMILEDKMGPTFDCPSPIIANCFDDLANLAPPMAVDNCDPNPEVTFVAQHIIDNDICDDGLYKVRRTYTANDFYGNQSANQCIFEVHLIRPDVDFPNDINWHCEQYATYPGIIDPIVLNVNISDVEPNTQAIDVSPVLPPNVLSNTGSGVVNNFGGVCSYHVSHSDQTVNSCGNTFKIIRTWTVIDWCTGDIVTQGPNGEDNVQTIHIIDDVAPNIAKSNFQVSANIPSQGHQPCRSQGILPPPDSFSDNCQSNADINIQIVTSIGEAIYFGTDGKLGGMIPPPGLPIGNHQVVYRAQDACGNTDSVVVQVQIVDDLTPTAVCDELTEANLTTNGTATVFAATFDDGSHDNCCLVNNFQVRRMTDPCDDGHDDTVFGPSVTFCCEDVGTGPHMVVFRVFDCFDNFNDCMVEVVVNDKQAPLLISCPNDARINCDEYADDFETQLANLAGEPVAQNELFDNSFGIPLFQDNCDFTLSKDISVNIDQCLEGIITRTWFAVDPGGLTSQTCSQTIFVDHVSDWVVAFAPDVTINCGEATPDFVEPEIFFEDCEMVAVSFDDMVSNVVQGACFKIERTWVVINWCVLGELTDEEVVELPESQLGLPFPACDLDGDGDCDERTFRDSWNNVSQPDASVATQSTNPDTDPDSDPWDGYITYTQTIKAIDAVDPVFTSVCDTFIDVVITGSTCEATFSLPTPTVSDCSPLVDITASHSFGPGFGFGPFTSAPDTLTVTYNAMDNCNNQASCQATIGIRDGKLPTPKCKPGLIVGIMNTNPPMIFVEADSLDDGSMDNCSGPLQFSFSIDVNYDTIFFSCEELGDTLVEVWVTDMSGNQDFCTTTITIQDNMNFCPDDPLVAHVSGVIDTELGEPLEGVTVNMNGQNTGSQTTPLSGDFNFGNISVGNDVTITPTFDDNPLNGVSTFDLVLISQHVLGISSLDSPYKLIAADANNSGSITTFDMLQIRKLILFIDTEFPNNDSWRFVDKAFTFPNTSDPWETPFPEVININDIPSDVLDADFVAIKIGDVNGSASANFLGSNEDRSPNENLILEAEERNLTRGEKFTLSLSAKEETLAGFQFTLQFDPDKMEFLEVENAQLDGKNFGFTFLDNGYLTVSWNGNLDTQLPAIKLQFRALKNVRLGNAVQLNSRYTSAESYLRNGSLMGVELDFVDGAVSNNFELYQNVPNPFSNATIISFHLPRASMATLSITDVQGRSVRTVTNLFEAGYNEIELGQDELPANGIYYYRLETPTDSDTKTMILLD